MRYLQSACMFQKIIIYFLKIFLEIRDIFFFSVIERAYFCSFVDTPPAIKNFPKSKISHKLSFENAYFRVLEKFYFPEVCRAKNQSVFCHIKLRQFFTSPILLREKRLERKIEKQWNFIICHDTYCKHKFWFSSNLYWDLKYWNCF